MDHDRFIDLAWRRLENPADGDLRQAVEDALADHPEWLESWQSLRDGYALHHEAGVIAGELATPAPTTADPAEMPWDKLGLGAPAPSAATASPPRPRRTKWSVGFATVAAAAVVAIGLFVLRGGIPTPVELAPAASPSLARFLTAPLPELLASATPRVQRASAPIWLRQPIVAAAAGPVTIAWGATDPASRHDVTLISRGRAIWTAEDAVSPVTTPALPADGVYEVQLVPAAGTRLATGTVSARFITVNAPGRPAKSLTDIVTVTAAEPARLGEAVAAWWALDDDVRASESGIRLGLWLGMEARQPDMIDEARRLAARPAS